MKPVILLHGWATGPGIWRDVLAGMEEGGCKAPPLAGYGDAPVVAGLEETVTDMAARLPESSVVCGWSLGALVALELARLFPRRVARLLLVAATPRFVAANDWPWGMPREQFMAFSDGVVRDAAKTVDRFLSLQALGDAGKQGVVRTLKKNCSPPPLPVLEQGLKILAETDLRNRLGEISQPALVLAGGRDRIVPPGASSWLADALPRGEFRLFGAAGHAPFVSHSEEFCRLLGAAR